MYQSVPAETKTVSTKKLAIRIGLLALAVIMAIVGIAAVAAYSLSLGGLSRSITIVDIGINDNECDQSKGVKTGLVGCGVLGAVLLGLLLIEQALLFCMKGLVDNGCHKGCGLCMLTVGAMSILVSWILLIVLYTADLCDTGVVLKDVGYDMGPAVGILPVAVILALVSSCVNPVEAAPQQPADSPMNRL